MATPKPTPLFPKADEMVDFDLRDYPGISEALDSAWKKENWQYAFDFLAYIRRNKSEHTFVRFRSEIEKLLLWLFLIKQQP